MFMAEHSSFEHKYPNGDQITGNMLSLIPNSIDSSYTYKFSNDVIFIKNYQHTYQLPMHGFMGFQLWERDISLVIKSYYLSEISSIIYPNID
jgi:hypothetical protein